MLDLDQLLHHYWGSQAVFRSHQRAIVNCLAQQQDVLAVLPTGEGKSLCYQLGGLLLGGLTVVLTPLRALMADQVQQLYKRQLTAGTLYSGQNPAEQQRIWQQLQQQQLQFLYLSPEQFQNARLQRLLKQFPPRLLVIDEAHCVSLWGHDFRPMYRSWPALLQEWSHRPVMAAFTATATAMIRADIINQCGLQQPQVFVMSALRDNVALQVHPLWTPAGRQRCLNRLLAMPGKHLIYAATRLHIDRLAKKLQAQGMVAHSYHAGLPAEVRDTAYEWFCECHAGILVASTAFGMGVDIPDIAQVIHWETPASVESYLQEAGRVARNRQFIGQAHLLALRFTGSHHAHAWQTMPTEKIQHFWRQVQQHYPLSQIQRQLVLSPTDLHLLVGYLQQQGVLEAQSSQRLQAKIHGKLPLHLCRDLQQTISQWQVQQKQRSLAMYRYLYTKICRRLFMDRYFGLTDTTACGQCDNCNG